MTDINDYDVTLHVLALCRFGGVGPRLFETLTNYFGSPQRILQADTADLMKVNGMTAEAARGISGGSERLPQARAFHNEMTSREICISNRFDGDFPNRLFELNDPPPLLYVRGKMPDQTKKLVALAGAENATGAGIQLTTTLARRFAESGVQVIASLSKGNDAAVHVGAKAAGGNTFSILDAGFDHVDPAEHFSLAIDIAKTGGVITESPPDQTPTADSFTRSNRILSAWSQAVVITEVYQDSVRTRDLISCCHQIGKLTFIMADHKSGVLTDEATLNEAVSLGAIPLAGLEKVDDIIKVLV